MKERTRMPRGLMQAVGLATLLAIFGSGGASAIDWGREAYQEDADTCHAMGANFGRDFTWCMMQQQQRRDELQHNATEQQLNNAAAAALNLETLRRIRCHRAAEEAIRQGEQPQVCS